MNILDYHFIESTIRSHEDKGRWLAYLILKEKYPALTYWSHDGYSCDALADYSKNLVWHDWYIVDWTTKGAIIRTENRFTSCTTPEICDVWMRVNGETEKTKNEWLDSLLVKSRGKSR